MSCMHFRHAWWGCWLRSYLLRVSRHLAMGISSLPVCLVMHVLLSLSFPIEQESLLMAVWIVNERRRARTQSGQGAFVRSWPSPIPCAHIRCHNQHTPTPSLRVQKKDGPRVGVAMVCGLLMGMGFLRELGAKTTVGGLIRSVRLYFY
jgi:hypothetical protein